MEGRGERTCLFLWSDVRRVIVLLFLAACSPGEPTRRYGLGQPASAAQIAERNVDVGPDGEGLPAGRGSAADGAVVYAAKCASCHGDRGEGKRPAYPTLVGRDTSAENFVFGQRAGLTRTIGNYWPNATTVFDYVRRAMPQTAPGSLSNDEVYAVTAYLLAMNQVIADTVVLDSATLSGVKMPYASRFVRDNRRGNDVR